MKRAVPRIHFFIRHWKPRGVEFNDPKTGKKRFCVSAHGTGAYLNGLILKQRKDGTWESLRWATEADRKAVYQVLYGNYKGAVYETTRIF